MVGVETLKGPRSPLLGAKSPPGRERAKALFPPHSPHPPQGHCRLRFMRQVIANDFHTEAHARLRKYPKRQLLIAAGIYLLWSKALNQGVMEALPCPRKMVKAKERVGPTDSPEAV